MRFHSPRCQLSPFLLKVINLALKTWLLLERSYKGSYSLRGISRPHIVNPISCVFTNKWRLVVDFRLLNPYVVQRKIKLEDLSCVPAIVFKNDFMSKDDLEKDIGIYV